MQAKRCASCDTLALERSNGRFVDIRTHVTTPIGLAIVGAGRMGVKHLRALTGEPSVRLRAIVDPSEQARTSAASASPETPAYADLDAAVAGGGIDAVLIAVSPASREKPNKKTLTICST